MEELLLKLIEEVRKTYKDKKAADLVFKRLFAATKDSSDYTEAYEFAKRAGHDLEDAIIENWEALMQDSEVFASTAKQLLKGVVPDMNEDILKACEQIQDNKNAAAGMRIKPQTAVADPYDLNRIAEGLDGKKMSALDGELATHACKTVDETMKANMDFANNLGYEVVVTREYDGVGLHRKTKYAERCEYCYRRKGTKIFKNSTEASNSGIFARHEGCGCTIDYENKKTGTRNRSVNNYNTGVKKEKKIQGNKKNVNENLEKEKIRAIMKEQYVIEDKKIKGFLLRPGAKHSHEFFNVGYTVEDDKILKNDIISNLNDDIQDYMLLEDGERRFSIFMELGKTKKRTFQTVWQLVPNSNNPRMVTAHRVTGEEE